MKPSQADDVGVELSTQNFKKKYQAICLIYTEKNIQIGCRLASDLKYL